MTDLTDAQIGALEAPEGPDALLSFIEVVHPALPATKRFVTDVLDFVWGGETYRAIGGMEMPLADDADSPARPVVTIPNIDREVGETLEAVPTRAVVRQTVLSSADFDLTADPRTEIGTALPIYDMADFEVVSASWDAVAAEITLMLRDYSQEQYGLRATPDLLPGVFR